MIVLVILAVQLLGLLLSVIIDPYVKVKKKLLIEVIILLFSLLLQNYMEYRFDTDINMPYLRTIVGIYGYCVRPMILALFCCIVKNIGRSKIVWILNIINAIVHLTALFSGICFTITEDNSFVRGPLGYTCHIISGLLLAYLLWQTFREFVHVKKSDMIIPILNVIVIPISVLFDSEYYVLAPYTFLTIAVVTGTMFYYIWLHMQFVREHEEDLKAQQRIQIMMTQIQPHFLYNTLATLKAMCKKDPDTAAELAEKFGLYLRQNLDSLGTVGRIPFEKELEHTRLYAGIEMVRFENLDVKYHITDASFTVPPLSLQPLVENAIKHGVRIREKGIVEVTTAFKDGFHEITVSDNGTGFDVKKAEKAEGSHIGLKNVRERIEQMCNGTLTIDSREDEGTTIIIRIPDNNN